MCCENKTKSLMFAKQIQLTANSYFKFQFELINFENHLMNCTFQSRPNCVVVLANVLAVAGPMGLVIVLALLNDVL